MSKPKQPPQPPDGPPAPTLAEGLLDDAGLAALLGDIQHVAQLIGVRVKGGTHRHAVVADLEDAAEALRAGARGVQLRYDYDGEEWWDTVMPAPGGWRVLRMRRAPPPQ